MRRVLTGALAAVGRGLAAAVMVGMVSLARPPIVQTQGAVPQPFVTADDEPRPADYRVVQWTTAQGLPQNSVTGIVLLPSGALWVGTFGGLARFDGQQFHVVDMASHDQLPSLRIVSMAAAGSEAFWFLTQQGHLGRMERGQPRAILAPPIAAVDALGLLADRRGHLYARSVTGTLWQSNGADAWQSPPGAPGRHWGAQSFAETETGDVWTAWDGRLTRIDGGDQLASVAVTSRHVAVFRRRGGGLWVGLDRGLARLLGRQLTTLEVRPPFEAPVTALTTSPDGTVWVASFGDVSRLRELPDGSWRRSPLPLGLPEGTLIRSLEADGAGSLWVGTTGAGLFRVNLPGPRRFGAELGSTFALAPDGQGGAFVASGCRGLSHFAWRGVATTVALWPTGVPAADDYEGCGLSLATAPDGGSLVRAGPRVFRIGRRLVPEPTAIHLPASEGPLVAMPDGSVWAVSRGGAVQHVSPDGVVLREMSLPPPLMSLSLAADGTVWVGGDGQLTRITADGTERFEAVHNVPRGMVRDILPDTDGTVWIGTYGGGVGRLKDGQVFRLTVEHGLPDNSISRLLDDGRGRLWVSTNRGVVVVEKRDLHAVADRRLSRLLPVVFGPERGVAEANFGSPAGFREPSGRLWFTTIEGAVSIDAAAFPFNTTPPVVRIEGIWADDRPIDAGRLVAIPALTTRVRVGFTGFDLVHAELLRFRYRVEGADTDWVDAGGQRSVVWAPPSPGRYRVLIEARNADGVWSAAPAQVVLDVLPAWWQTTFVRGGAALSLLVLGVALSRWRVRQVEHRHAEQVRRLVEQRQAEERAAALRAQLEHVSRAALAGELAASLAHEVRQPLGAIVNNAEAGRRHLTQHLQQPGGVESIFDDIVADGLRASEVVDGLRGFLQSRLPDAGPVDLSAVVREVLPLLRRELEDHRIEVSVSLAADPPVVEGFRVQLGQIVANLVMNACEALSSVDGPRRLLIGTLARDGGVELSVEDNGPGPSATVTDRLFTPFVTTKPEGLGMGLAISRSIASAHGGRLTAHRPSQGGLRMVLWVPAAPRPEVRS